MENKNIHATIIFQIRDEKVLNEIGDKNHSWKKHTDQKP